MVQISLSVSYTHLANYIAKQKGVKTGMALWQAKQICPEIIFVPPRMDLYLRFSQMAREISVSYTHLDVYKRQPVTIAGNDCRIITL